MSTAWRTRAVRGSGPPPSRPPGRALDRGPVAGRLGRAGRLTRVGSSPSSKNDTVLAPCGSPEGRSMPVRPATRCRVHVRRHGQDPCPGRRRPNPVETAEQPTQVMERHASQALVLDRYRLVRRLGRRRLRRRVARARRAAGPRGRPEAHRRRGAGPGPRGARGARRSAARALRHRRAVRGRPRRRRGLPRLGAGARAHARRADRRGRAERSRRAADRRRAVRRARACAQPRRRAPRRQAAAT